MVDWTLFCLFILHPPWHVHFSEIFDPFLYYVPKKFGVLYVMQCQRKQVSLFLYYHCGSEKVTPIGPLGMKVNATDTWERQSETLTDLVEELKRKLLDIKPQISTTSGKSERLRAGVEQFLSHTGGPAARADIEARAGPRDVKVTRAVDTRMGQRICPDQRLTSFPWGADPLALQGGMLCPYKANGCMSGSWHFDVCGLENRKCTVVVPGERLLKETSDNGSDVTKFLMKISDADCQNWLDQFLVPWEKMLETTGN
ncbi:UL16-binding protein 1-like [Equus caballus]|uniref:UL16-binding protein 1-like n=1 Tax=Equus caballus TaxID=9796 RepID=UPI000C9DCE38|nr:UL16-binding protein 1-like [Equus caballus]